MTYEAHIQKHNGERIIIHYDENKNEVIRAIQKYVKENAFTYYDREGNHCTCATFLLVEKTDRTNNAKVISEKKYHEIFDTITGKPKEVEECSQKTY